MKSHRVLLFAWGGLVAILVGWNALGGQPVDHLRTTLEQAVRAMEDPLLAARPLERRHLIRSLADGVVDWPEMARRTLGEHWEERTAAERAEFVEVFAALVERTYAGWSERWDGAQMIYTGQAIDAADAATVRTRVVTRERTQIPLDFRMLRRDERWLVYDVVINGTSLADAYRSRFGEILRTRPYGELLRLIRTPTA